MEELGHWVALYSKRAIHRKDDAKVVKDLDDAKNYLDMMQAKLAALRDELGFA